MIHAPVGQLIGIMQLQSRNQALNIDNRYIIAS